MSAEKYSYAAQPHAAPMGSKTTPLPGAQTSTTAGKPKYRDLDADAESPQNLMYDARVVRGNTYAPKVMSSSLKNELEPRKAARTKKDRRGLYSTSKRSSTPPPVDGRSHMNMQTDDFLEELTDRPVEADAETQTGPIMDRPASPLFVRAKIGFDVSTQIEHGDLFDFNTEVEPILEVLVGKTLHVAMLEIMQEEELAAIRLQQEEYETIRNIELAEVQCLEAEIKRKALEKERRLAQEKKRLEDRQKLDETIAARQFTQQFLGDLHVSVFDTLEAEGHFFDPVKREVEELFLGSLLAGVGSGAENFEAANIIAMELLDRARQQARAFEQECIRLRQEARAAQAAKEEEERRQREEEARLAKEAAEAAERAELEGVPPAEE